MESDVLIIGFDDDSPAAVPGLGPVVVNSLLSLLPISTVVLAGSYTMQDESEIAASAKENKRKRGSEPKQTK